MKRIQLLGVVSCLLLSGGGPICHPSLADSIQDQPPPEPQAQRALAAELQRLRAQADLLSAQVRRLENLLTNNAANHKAGEPGEKERLAAQAQTIITRCNSEKAGIWKHAHGKIRDLRLAAGKSLGELRDRYTREAKLDEALAIRDAISCLTDPARKILTDPDLLRTIGEPGRVLFFRVTGAASGSLYGTDVYTSDSSLATAAVHAGVLKVEQTGVVRVTTIPSHVGFVSSTRNGITSSAWGSHPAFRVEALTDEDGDLDDVIASEAGQPGAEPRPPKYESEPKPPHAPMYAPIGGTPAPALPADARREVDLFESAAAGIRQEARAKVTRLLSETISLLAPIQDAHTRAARLDEAITIRDLIRKLEECSDRR